MSFWQQVSAKLNPVQEDIAMREGSEAPTSQTKIHTVQNAYDHTEIVNRCINLLVDNSSMVNYDVAGKLDFTAVQGGVRTKTLNKMLNHRPNPYMDINTFRRLLIMDFLIDGNMFIHFDGHGLYHIPAQDMTVVADEETYINSFKHASGHTFKANEIIFVKDNSAKTLYRGDSRVSCSLDSLFTRESMIAFQKSFFDNGAAVGLIIETDSILSKKMKERQEQEWMQKYNPRRGSGRPMILDGGLKVRSTSESSFRDMSFNDSITSLESKVAMALGVPPILLDSGNNANIKPNLELMFYTTILPMLRKVESALEYYFAYDIELSTHRVPALRPDQKDESERLSALVNNGIITGNEAREVLRLEELDDPNMTKIRIPQNVAGSGTGVTGQEGGAPPKKDK